MVEAVWGEHKSADQIAHPDHEHVGELHSDAWDC